MKVPFVDLGAQYLSIKNEIDESIKRVVQEQAFVRGKYVEKFEEDFASRYNMAECVSCANGTDAIYISLKALDIGPGDEVITTALSWISTSETITQAGARVVFADIEPNVFTIDPRDIERKITTRTRAIIPVHLYGQPAEMDAIMAVAKKHGLFVVEDCAQAHFARYKNRLVGTIGNVGTFSFYPGKNLGAYGDAGAIIFNDLKIARRARMFANHGSLNKHRHELEGINSRMDGIQAAVLLAKLGHIDAWNKKRRDIAQQYVELLEGLDSVITPCVRDHNEHVYHLYVVRARNREALIRGLDSEDIGFGIHYPVALPFLKAYEYLGHLPNDFPIAHQYQSEILSLPMYPEMADEMIQVVAREVAGVCQ